MTNNTERRAFEAHVTKKLLLGVETLPDGQYESQRVRELWLTWQAALSQRENTAKPLEQVGEWVIIPRELAENFLYSTEVPRFKRILSAALAQREKEAPSLCTAEEAAELAETMSLWDEIRQLTEQMTEQELAAIINAVRAKR
jgi:hypothetical protein